MQPRSWAETIVMAFDTNANESKRPRNLLAAVHAIVAEGLQVELNAGQSPTARDWMTYSPRVREPELLVGVAATAAARKSNGPLLLQSRCHRRSRRTRQPSVTSF